jgi:putative Mn2+ efflux pump MntP
MVGDLLILGFMLSLDNFRTAIALGPLRLRWRQAGQVAFAFGFWDAVAPLLGILAGHFVGQTMGATAEYAGAIALAAYGVYLLARAWRAPAPEEFDSVRVLFGLPLPLSLDNVVAGTSLGLVGVSPWLTAPLFGAITALMSLLGFQLGRAAAHFIRIRSDVLTGVALVVMATVVGLGQAR